MMKKIFSKLFIILIFGALVYSSIFEIGLTEVEAAKTENVTLGYYEEQLANYKRQAEENRKAINKTENEINYSKNKIASLKREALELVEEVKKLDEEIQNHKESITKKLEQSKQILEYMQITSGKNVYLDYVFKADSVTELINRNYAVKEIVAYNEKTIAELEQIIEDNEKREVEIEKRNKKIEETQEQLASNIVTLGETKNSLTTGGTDIAGQIKMYEDQVKAYKKLGCKTNDVIGVDCAVTGGTGVFRRPTATGYVTQEQYYTRNYTHRGIDIGSKNRRSEKIYPIADGVITAKYIDNWGALVLAIEHYNINDGKYYTSLYAHMSSYAPGLELKQKITSNQYIGYMGDTGKATGVHLHMEVIPCRLNNPADKNCYSLNAYLNYAPKVLANGFNLRSLINFPKGLYNSWNSR